MSKKQRKLKGLKSRFHLEDRKSLIMGSVIATILAIIPYLFSLYESVPETKLWNTFFGTYTSGFFENANTAMWVITVKAIPLLLLLIWFFTNRHWWYHVLLVPISMYLIQLISLFYDEQFLDKFQLIYMIPVMAIVIPSIYLVRAKIFNKINTANKSLQELEDEFKISPKSFWGKMKQYF